MPDRVDIPGPERLSELCALVGLDPESRRTILSLRKDIFERDECWQMYHAALQRLVGGEAYEGETEDDTAIARDRLGDAADTYNLLLVVSGVAKMLEIHRAHQIPAAVTRDTALDISLRAEAFRESTHVLGLETQDLKWFRGHLTGGLYRLGRLQFRHFFFHGSVFIFRHRESGRVIAMSKPGTVFNSRGLRDGVNGMCDSSPWTATFEMTEHAVKGCPIAPNGYAIRDLQTLSLSSWEHVLSPGDPMLDMHVPAGGGMSPEACARSMDAAHDFFQRYFPRKPFGGFVCRSWFLDPQLREILPPESNIIKFQKSCYQFPTIGGDGSALQRIFGDGGAERAVDSLPRDNSLRCAVVDFMKQGGRLGMGACFFLKADLPWRMNVYQKECEPLAI